MAVWAGVGGALFRQNKSEKKFPDGSGIYALLRHHDSILECGYSVNYQEKIGNHSLFKLQPAHCKTSSPSSDYITGNLIPPPPPAYLRSMSGNRILIILFKNGGGCKFRS